MGRQSVKTRQNRKAAAVASERQEAIAQMNSALKKKFDSFEKRAGDARADNLKYYYNFGKELAEIANNPDKYDRRAMQLLEAALPTQKRTLRKMKLFADTYSPEEFDELLEMRNDEANFAIHWGHLSYLLGLNTQALRFEYSKKAVEQLLDPPALHALIKRRNAGGNRAASPHGRTHTLPRTLSAQIRQMMEVSRVWVAKNKDVWNGDAVNVINNIMTEAPDKYTADQLHDLAITKELMESMVQSAKINAKALDRAIKHVTAAIENQAKQATTAEVVRQHGRQPRSINLSSGRRAAVAAS